MTNKILIIENINATLAAVAISIKSGEPSTVALVLAELIEASENSVITHTHIVGPAICEKLSITPENYRAAISKLTKLKLICRLKNSTIFLDALVKTPFKDVVLRQKQ